jgi:hypothetical protein
VINIKNRDKLNKKLKSDDHDEIRTVIFDVIYLGQCGCGYKEGLLRKIELKETQTLINLHEAIQRDMKWYDPHLYSFFMDGKAWSKNRDMEYTSPDADESVLKNFSEEMPKTADVKIKNLNLRLKKKFLYVFDFGDNHHFSIQVVGFGKAKKSKKYPKLVESVGKAPHQYTYCEE